jgi:phage-related protein
VNQEEAGPSGPAFLQQAYVPLLLHAFAKKTQKIAPADIQTGRRRLKEMLDEQV